MIGGIWYNLKELLEWNNKTRTMASVSLLTDGNTVLPFRAPNEEEPQGPLGINRSASGPLMGEEGDRKEMSLGNNNLIDVKAVCKIWC